MATKLRGSEGLSVIINTTDFSIAGGTTTERRLSVSGGDIAFTGDGNGYVHTLPPRTDNIIGRIENHSMTLVAMGGYI